MNYGNSYAQYNNIDQEPKRYIAQQPWFSSTHLPSAQVKTCLKPQSLTRRSHSLRVPMGYVSAIVLLQLTRSGYRRIIVKADRSSGSCIEVLVMRGDTAMTSIGLVIHGRRDAC